MAKIQERPIDRAQSATTRLSSICDLLSIGGNEEMHMVNSGDLAMLLRHTHDEIEEALEELARASQKSNLRMV